jgi:hypothetical protein
VNETIAEDFPAVLLEPGDALPATQSGVEDGTVDANGEKIVHEEDNEDGTPGGWHKEAAA